MEKNHVIKDLFLSSVDYWIEYSSAKRKWKLFLKNADIFTFKSGITFMKQIFLKHINKHNIEYSLTEELTKFLKAILLTHFGGFVFCSFFPNKTW